MWSDIYKLPRATEGIFKGQRLPWYTVYGNHDTSQYDIDCACGKVADSSCYQVQKHLWHPPDSNLIWYMPSRSGYHINPVKGLPLEIIAMDQNRVDGGHSYPTGSYC
jgi:hypothetical protein